MSVSFSIIIPVFNAAETLHETLESISKQSLREFEVIIVNDGSTDDSAKIIEEWKKGQDFHVEVIHQENKNQAAARNAGIARARREWIALLDADDIWEPKKLAVMHRLISQTSAEVYYHQVRAFGLGQKRIRKAYQIDSVNEILIKGNPVVPSATILSKHILQAFPFNEDPSHQGVEDLHLWLRLLHAGKKFCFFEAVLARYRESGGISSRIDEHLRRVFNMLEGLCRKGFFSQQELAVAKRRKYLEAARFYHKRKDFETAQKFYVAADFKTAKVIGLRFLSFLGISI